MITDKNDTLFFYSTITRSLNAKNLPIDVSLEVTNSCNLHCIMCREHPSLNGKAITLNANPKIKKELGAALKKAKQVGLFGWGEPLLFPNYGNLIKELRSLNPKACLSFTTNGQLLTPALIEQIIDAKIDFIIVSIDSADPKTYESIRRGASFARLVRNIELFNEIKSKRNASKPLLWMEVVIMRNNINQLLDILEFARAKKFLAITLEWVRNVPDLLVADYSPYAEEIKNFFARAKEYGIKLIGPFVQHRPDLCAKHITFDKKSTLKAVGSENTDSKHIPSMKCLHPWHTLFITNAGDIRPCCVTDKAYGNLNENSFEEIWNGESFRYLRKSIASGNYNPSCMDCIKNERPPALIIADYYPKFMKFITNLHIL